MAQSMAFLLTILFICSFTSTMAAYNIADFGAKPDGRTDSAKPFLSAWAAACGSNSPATIIVPTGRFLLSQALFQGPCKNSNIRIFISGTIVAPSGYGSNTAWIAFNYVQGLSIFGGTLDGQGQSFWACELAGRSCPKGATHWKLRAYAAGRWCAEHNSEISGVHGVRVKTWGKPYTGFVKRVRFEHAIMQNVQNPIVIDQNYCPGNNNCPGQSSGVKISQVTYSDIHGSSATQVAVKFDCSPSNPCSRIVLQNINLNYLNKQAQSYCKNVQGSTSGFVIPPSCL